ncbi:MAG: murein hydrolase activator EnvC family protein [Cytophagales bacterium]
MQKKLANSPFLFFILFTAFIYAQTPKKRVELEKEKQDNQRKLEEASKILGETRTKKTTTLGQLTVITQQIKEKTNQIIIYEKEIGIIDIEIKQTENSIKDLKVHLGDLKKEYAQMIYNAAKANDTYSKLIFLFSSNTFNQLVQRIKYFQYYSQARKKHVKQINKVAITLNAKRKLLYAKRKERSNVVVTVRQENTNLSGLKSDQEVAVAELSKRESELLDELEERKKNLKKLEKLILDLIKKEIEKAAAEAKAAETKAKLENKPKKVPETNYATNNFSAAKGKLFWPIQQGFISQKFGRFPHPVLKNVMVENLGVDIQTNKGEKVRTVFDGTVMAVAEVPGMNQIVMVQHGEYYTFYAKLKNVIVKNGQKIKAKEMIADVFTNEEEVSEVQFQVWKGNEKQDPEQWLYDK